jgi:hypothetical protein
MLENTTNINYSTIVTTNAVVRELMPSEYVAIYAHKSKYDVKDARYD